MIAPQTTTSLARVFHAFVAVLGLAALIAQLTLTIRGIDVLVPADGVIASTPMRVVRFFSYFTIQSNVLVIVMSASLALLPTRDGGLWRVARLDSLVGITVTGIVYAIVLAPIVDLHGLSGLTDKIFHYAIPVLAVVGWLLFGPRPRIDLKSLLWSGLWPLLYIVYVVIFGATTQWYPYPFTDVTNLGYARVILNGLVIIVLILAVGAGFRWLDKKLPIRP